VTAIAGTTSGVTMAPTLDPALKMPTASARRVDVNGQFAVANLVKKNSFGGGRATDVA